MNKPVAYVAVTLSQTATIHAWNGPSSGGGYFPKSSLCGRPLAESNTNEPFDLDDSNSCQRCINKHRGEMKWHKEVLRWREESAELEARSDNYKAISQELARRAIKFKEGSLTVSRYDDAGALLYLATTLFEMTEQWGGDA